MTVGRLWMPGSKLLAVALLLPPALWRLSGWRANLWVYTYRHYTSFIAWYLLCSTHFLSLRGFCCYWRYSVCFTFQVDEALTIKNTDIAKELCLPPVKLHCSSMFLVIICIDVLLFRVSLHMPVYLTSNFLSSVLAEDAIKAALADYHLKQQDYQQEAVRTSN